MQSICSYLPQEMQIQVSVANDFILFFLVYQVLTFYLAQCEEMVEIGTPVLINFLITEMGPKVLCQVCCLLAGSCTSPTS